MAFKDRLREARKSKGLTQKDVAELIGVATSTYTGYEIGNSEPYMSTVKKLIDALDIDANFLFQDESDLIEFKPTLHEKNLIEKYRDLAYDSKSLVDSLLDSLYKKDNNQALPASHLEPPPKRDSVEKTK